MTKCPESSAASLLQTKTHGANSANSTNSFKLCQVSDGGVELHFDDPKLQAKVERVMTPDARRMLRAALGQIPLPKNRGKASAALLELFAGGAAKQPATADMN